ncbi:MAG: KH domain-containing protein [Selenomonas sp.]|jgi:predicted RNA-binding protein YlqC (UPF0109 family)|nr:KH domain-containing protein [Selenomonas sp.]MCI7331982.1 KH domain-containing protein [Selenomonadaceae bacterium]MDD6120748.1 KH domain-containing protein [Selenomonadaceae bacterium]MDD7057029.1 KH domain-containing protein [Selenomonadaceae bacterium]MDY3916486.1 KH domain-containing protein [Selenomonadaceae bacterium]
MKDIVAVIARALVDQPEAVVTTEQETADEIAVSLHVAEGDMGKVIGRHGRIAKAIRTVVKAAAVRTNKKVTVEII